MSISHTRIPSLDGLRGFSILLVVAGHAAGTHGSPAWTNGLHQLGAWGVKFFFVISGYIITRMLVEEFRRDGALDLRSFWARRTARILPAYLMYVACIFAAAGLGAIEVPMRDFAGALTFTMNYQTERSWYLNHTWSISVEEQFYLVWPLLIILLGTGRALALACAVIVAAIFARWGMWSVLGASPTLMTRALPAVADALAAGSALALLERNPWALAFFRRVCGPRMTIVMFVTAFALPAVLFLVSPGLHYVLGQTPMTLAIMLAVRGAVQNPDGLAGRVLHTRFFVWHGAISYSLYLWQEPFLNTFEDRWFTAFPLNLVLSYVCALASYRLVETPARAALNRWFSGRRAARASGQA